MAKKSKTQRAKASAARAQRKEQARAAAEKALEEPVKAEAKEEEKPKRSFFKKSEDKGASQDSAKKSEAKAAKPKKNRFQFLRDVKSEMKRVTWPSKQDVLQWTGVVVVALLFFGLYVAVLDNAIVTPLLVLVSGIGA